MGVSGPRLAFLLANSIAGIGALILIGSGDLNAHWVGLLCALACVMGQVRAVPARTAIGTLLGLDRFALLLALAMSVAGVAGISGVKPPGVILGWTFLSVGIANAIAIGRRVIS